MTHRNLTCSELEERLDDFLEGTLDDSAVAELELHLAGCPACASLVRDFETITRQAAALHPFAPPRDLWPAIQARIESPVVELSSRRRVRPPVVAWHRFRPAAIAAGLMAITAVTTWTLATRDRSSSVATGGAPAVEAPGASAPSPSMIPSGSARSAPESSATSTATATATVSAPERRGEAAVGHTLPVTAPPSARSTYNTEISQLRGVLRERSEQLDPRTVAILESSIATIDSAIAEARAALARDPASPFLAERLDKTLEKKLGLLRTAALLPART